MLVLLSDLGDIQCRTPLNRSLELFFRHLLWETRRRRIDAFYNPDSHALRPVVSYQENNLRGSLDQTVPTTSWVPYHSIDTIFSPVDLVKVRNRTIPMISRSAALVPRTNHFLFSFAFLQLEDSTHPMARLVTLYVTSDFSRSSRFVSFSLALLNVTFFRFSLVVTSIDYNLRE